VLVRLRHAAVQAEDEDLAEYFDHLVLARGPSDPDRAEAEIAIYDFLPGNLKEMRYVAELLRRIRADDPAIEPALRHMDQLIEETRARMNEEWARQRASRPPRPKLRDRLLAVKREREEREERERAAKTDEEKKEG
jgi:hypothetical protein